MKNIHLFETKNAYDAAKSGLILPTVSYVKEKKDVNYFPVRPYVEIAGIKWATMNVGANSITDTGLYFQWGDTQGYTADQVGKKEDGKKPFANDYSDYKWYDKDKNVLTKYYSGDNKTVLALEDDAVRANWGGSWRMPTEDEFGKLLGAVMTGTVTAKFESKDSVYGVLLTESGNELFFPECGYAYHGEFHYDSQRYWSSSLNTGNSYLASVIFNNDFNYLNRYYGCSVRGVLDEK